MIPDDLINEYMQMVFGNSEPGDALHHLLVATAGAADCTPLGTPDPAKLSVRVYALMPTAAVDALRYVAAAIQKATRDAKDAGLVIHFAALGLECNAVPYGGDALTENLVPWLEADGKLKDHPHAVEITRLYAACRDGRRWTGEHLLTPPGAMSGPTVRVGALVPREHGEHERLIRAAVGC